MSQSQCVLIILSDQLAIVALVSHYLTNKLIAHRSIQPREVITDPPLSPVGRMRY